MAHFFFKAHLIAALSADCSFRKVQAYLFDMTTWWRRYEICAERMQESLYLNQWLLLTSCNYCSIFVMYLRWKHAKFNMEEKKHCVYVVLAPTSKIQTCIFISRYISRPTQCCELFPPLGPEVVCHLKSPFLLLLQVHSKYQDRGRDYAWQHYSQAPRKIAVLLPISVTVIQVQPVL